jgi:hypothetical protein
MNKAIFRVGLMAAIFALAACDSVGDGVRPVSLTLVPQGMTEMPEDDFEIFECLPGGVDAILEFSNGSRGLVTRRSANVRYSSSDESVVQVSNRPECEDPLRCPAGDFNIPGNLVFPQGTLIPVGPGTATITVEYVGFEASIDVTVLPLGEISLAQSETFSMAPDSLVQLNGTAVINGQTQSVRTGAEWFLDESEEDDLRVTPRGNDAGLMQARIPGGATRTATADFFLCSGTLDDNGELTRTPTNPSRILSVDVNVEPIQALEIVREYEPDGDGFIEPLVIGFTEFLRVLATFPSGAEPQDLTFQSFWATDEDDEEDVGLFLGSGQQTRSILIGLGDPQAVDEEEASGEGGFTSVTSTYIYVDRLLEEPETVELDSDPVVIEVRPAEVLSIAWAFDSGDGLETITEITIPRNCSIQPDVIGTFARIDEVGAQREFTRRVNREASYGVNPDDEDDEENGNGEGEAPDPVVQVRNRPVLPLDRFAGTITAVGEVGEEAIVRAAIAVVVEPPEEGDGGEQGEDVTGDEDDDEDPGFELREADLRVIVGEEVDCATLN